MPIPPLNAHGLLPAGIHECSLAEIEHRYARANVRRVLLWAKFVEFLTWARSVPFVTAVHVDGSFTTDKKVPGDIDIAFHAADKAVRKPTAAQAAHYAALRQREAIKLKYEVDTLFCFSHNMGIVEYFQFMRTEEAQRRGVPPDTRRGILRVAL